jgi:cytochrome c553
MRDGMQLARSNQHRNSGALARRLRRSALAVGATLALAACGAAEDPVSRGAALAAEKGCHACHGEKGVSQSPAFPNLAGQWPQYLRVQLLKYRSGERQNAVMNGQAANLTRREIADLAAFYAAQ